MSVTAIVLIAVWLVPSTLLWMFGQVRSFIYVFLWPMAVLILFLVACACVLQDGPNGLRMFWNHLNGKGYQ